MNKKITPKSCPTKDAGKSEKIESSSSIPQGFELIIDETTVFSTMKFIECAAPDNDNYVISEDEEPTK